jgi:putative ABC transport system permease protein
MRFFPMPARHTLTAMLSNYLAAALRHLARSRFYAAISIVGLAVGICALMLMLLVVRNELGYNRVVGSPERVFVAVSVLKPKQHPADYQPYVAHTLAPALKLAFPQIRSIARISSQTVALERGDVKAKENLYWADPAFFEVMPLPALAGNLSRSLQRPDGLVLPRSVARKYFGRDTPLGATLQLNGEQMTVTAIIEDLPERATDLETGIFASGLRADSALSIYDKRAVDPAAIQINNTTYLRLAPGASVETIRAGMPAIANAQFPRRPPGLEYEIELLPIDEAHLFPGLNPGGRTRVMTLAGIGLLTLIIASINFINLSTARASRRAREIAVRKTAGASRAALVVQFLGETLLYVLLATCIGVALTELLLPWVNTFLQTGATFDYTSDPALLGWLALGILVLTLFSGIYPAFVLTSFRPATVLKGVIAHVSGTHFARQALVTLQFAVLIGMLVAAAVVYQQRAYALNDALRVATDQHVMVETQCTAAISSDIRALPGVRTAGCTGECLISDNCFANIRMTDGSLTAYGVAASEPGVLESLGIRPIAGRLFDSPVETQSVVINEQARLRFGFASAQDAIGKLVPDASTTTSPRTIIGVVPDFSMASVERRIEPMVYYNRPDRSDLLDVQLTGQHVPEVLAALDRLEPRFNAGEPLKRYFLNDRIQDLYRSMLRMAQAFSAMAIVAVVLACLGLVGLSAAATDRRTKEIGIRKAMGAGEREIVWLLVWQFTKPAMWGALIAWPVSAYVMRKWLAGYAYHVDLTLAPFAGATAVALVIAIITVGVHSFSVARIKPVAALRYE